MNTEELLAQMAIMDGALHLSMRLAEAIGPLIPKPETLSVEQKEKWQKVVDVIFASAEYAEKHNLVQWSKKRNGIQLVKS